MNNMNKYIHFSAELQIVKEIKERLANITTDTNTVESPHRKPQCVQLPDGNEINVELGDELWQCGEAIFQPHLADSSAMGIHTMIHDTLLKCADADVRNNLAEDIVISGGNTCFTGKDCVHLK